MTLWIIILIIVIFLRAFHLMCLGLMCFEELEVHQHVYGRRPLTLAKQNKCLLWWVAQTVTATHKSFLPIQSAAPCNLIERTRAEGETRPSFRHPPARNSITLPWPGRSDFKQKQEKLPILTCPPKQNHPGFNSRLPSACLRTRTNLQLTLMKAISVVLWTSQRGQNVLSCHYSALSLSTRWAIRYVLNTAVSS